MARRIQDEACRCHAVIVLDSGIGPVIQQQLNDALSFATLHSFVQCCIAILILRVQIRASLDQKFGDVKPSSRACLHKSSLSNSPVLGIHISTEFEPFFNDVKISTAVTCRAERVAQRLFKFALQVALQVAIFDVVYYVFKKVLLPGIRNGRSSRRVSSS